MQGSDQYCTIVSYRTMAITQLHNIIVMSASSCGCKPPVQLYTSRQAYRLEAVPHWAQSFYTATCGVCQHMTCVSEWILR